VAFLNTLTDGYAPTSNIPEPSTWALMVIGFGMVGGVLSARHRRYRSA
jgi:hypothetical protein